MSADFPEPDWRQFKQVHARLLETFCTRILTELAAVNQSSDGTAHDRYLRAYRLLQQRDEEMANAFNDFRRSTAELQLVMMLRMKLLSDEDLNQFSEPTRQRVRAIAAL